MALGVYWGLGSLPESWRPLMPPSTAIPSELQLTALLYPEGKAWVAQCLEYDIAAQAPDSLECRSRLMRSISDQVALDFARDQEPFSKLGPAPESFFEQSLNAKPLAFGVSLPVHMPIGVRTRIRPRVCFLIVGAPREIF